MSIANSKLLYKFDGHDRSPLIDFAHVHEIFGMFQHMKSTCTHANSQLINPCKFPSLRSEMVHELFENIFQPYQTK